MLAPRIFGTIALLLIGAAPAPNPTPRIRLDTGHPWRPPFGIDRVGAPLKVVVEFDGARPPTGDVSLGFYKQGTEIRRQKLLLPSQPPIRTRVPLDPAAEEVAVFYGSDTTNGMPASVRQRVILPNIDAEAVATATPLINPVALGTVLVPAGWLLLGHGQSASLEVAAYCPRQSHPSAAVCAWFESAPSARSSTPFPITAGRRTTIRLGLPPTPPHGTSDSLHIELRGNEPTALWKKTIPVMIVREAPKLKWTPMSRPPGPDFKLWSGASRSLVI